MPFILPRRCGPFLCHLTIAAAIWAGGTALDGPWRAVPGLVLAAALTSVRLFPTPVLSGLAGAAVAAFCGLWLSVLALAAASLPLIALSRARRAANRARSDLTDWRAQQEAQSRQRDHDIRNPLNGMRGMFELLQRRDLGERPMKYVALGLVAATELENLLDPVPEATLPAEEME